VNRKHWQKLAEDRVLEAQALLTAGHWSGAYYLVGYAVECGLKACVLAHVESTGAIFRDKNFSVKCWTHDVEELVELAGLSDERERKSSTTPVFGRNWAIIKDWSEKARYQSWTETKARKLFAAVTDTSNGVLSWIRVRW